MARVRLRPHQRLPVPVGWHRPSASVCECAQRGGEQRREGSTKISQPPLPPPPRTWRRAHGLRHYATHACCAFWRASRCAPSQKPQTTDTRPPRCDFRRAHDDCLGGARVPPAEQVESSAVWAVLSGGGRGRKEPSGADYGAERANLMSVSRFDGSAPSDRPTWAVAKVARKGGQWRSRAEAAKNGDELGRLVACARVRR